MTTLLYILAASNVAFLANIGFLFYKLHKQSVNLNSKQQLLQQTLTSNLQLKREFQKLQLNNDQLLKELIVIRNEKGKNPLKL